MNVTQQHFLAAHMQSSCSQKLCCFFPCLPCSLWEAWPAGFGDEVVVRERAWMLASGCWPDPGGQRGAHVGRIVPGESAFLGTRVPPMSLAPSWVFNRPALAGNTGCPPSVPAQGQEGPQREDSRPCRQPYKCTLSGTPRSRACTRVSRVRSPHLRTF